MKKVQLPDPAELARKQATDVLANRDLYLKVPVDRVIADSPQVKANALLDGIEEFHRERMHRIPSDAKYPEAKPWVENALVYDHELQKAAQLTYRELAIVQSFHLFVALRGFRQARRQHGDERCRGAYLADSDHGPMTIGNVDDPITHWKPATGHPEVMPGSLRLNVIGVGNGLHIDDEPEELFPLPVLEMMSHFADTAAAGVEFLTRYCQFWGRCNCALFDNRGGSAAIEKCSFKYIDVFHPNSHGHSHVSGMTCRDPNTRQGKHQQAKRSEYLKLFNIPDDCADNAFWAACRKFEAKLASFLDALGPRPKADDVIRMFITPWPEGLNKTGLVLHPKQGLVGYTLQTHVSFIREKKYLRWQRSRDGKTYSKEPEVFQY